MTYATNRWHVYLQDEKIAECALISHADILAEAIGGDVRDGGALGELRLMTSEVAGFIARNR